MVDLSRSDHLFDLSLKSAMGVLGKDCYQTSHPDSFLSLSEIHEIHPEIE